MITNKVYIGGQKYKWVNQFAKTPEWKAIENYANTNSYALPTDVDAYDQLIIDLKSAGIWQKLDVFYVFVGDGSNGFKLINWKNPNQHYATAYGGLTWSNIGIKGNGTNGYIDTNYNTSTNIINRQQSNASTGIVSYHISQQNTGAPATFVGASGAFFQEYLNVSGVFTITTNRLNGSFQNLSWLKQIGWASISRFDASTGERVQGTVSESLTSTANSTSNIKIYLLRSNNNYGEGGMSMFYTGASLTYSETQSFRTSFNQFLTDIGETPVA